MLRKISSEDNGENADELAGSIYGEVIIQGKEVGPENTIVLIDGTDLVARVDRVGLFFFEQVYPGSYTIRARLGGYADDVLEDVEVRTDSLSLIASFLLRKGEEETKGVWSGLKIKRVSLAESGCIEGRVSSSARPLQNAYVYVPGTFWSTYTDSSGYYKMDILPGAYRARSFKSSDANNRYGFRVTEIYEVVILTKKVSIVDFELRSGLIREDKPPIKWVVNYSESEC